MSHITVAAHDTEAALRKKLRHAPDEAFKLRVKAIILLKQGAQRKDVVTQLTVDAKSVTTWLHRYNESGTDALTTNKGGRPEGNPKWDTQLFIDLAKEIDTGGYWSIPRMHEWLKTHKKKEVPEQTVWYRMDQLNYSYKSARPAPIGGDETKRSAFKKGASRHSWSR
jgi:transposase